MSNLQQTEDWYNARLGKLTASRFSDAMARMKNGDWGATRASYRGELVTERMTGLPYPSYQSPEMRWGKEQQQNAFNAYMMEHDVVIEDVGFIEHPTLSMSGASPDGLISDDGLIEVKCPASHTHHGYLHGGSIPLAYIQQMQWQIICTGRKWCDWVSFDPRQRAALQLEVRRVHRVDDATVALLEKMARDFLAEVQEEVQFLLRLEAQRLGLADAA